ncbi:MAG: BrnA antitoxin family protein [Methylococcales bacterium]|nr:BrnA antitoxin family protein [Methylococcales bacterium]MDD5754187.1 BrnA antitoxin family protein [Methylococcales bacterium]
MLITTKSGRVIEMPSDEEDERINAGIAADNDTYELSAVEFSQLKRVGRPVAEVTKARITIRVDKETLNVFKAKAETTGGNYQTLMNEALRKYAQHELAH